MAYFKDPIVVIQTELEEIQDLISRKEKKMKGLDKQIKSLERDKELMEGELEDLLNEEKSIKRKLNKARIDLE